MRCFYTKLHKYTMLSTDTDSKLRCSDMKKYKIQVLLTASGFNLKQVNHDFFNSNCNRFLTDLESIKYILIEIEIKDFTFSIIPTVFIMHIIACIRNLES